eukprot:gb/GECH01001570.1/.p1 GENE.gb/GECH01001570.1/~~gb/GECH01001570.1/.p1  ORF type:complete len:310 (+),score=74.65 gb/GECH01001570.1/:1-930(+)
MSWQKLNTRGNVPSKRGGSDITGVSIDGEDYLFMFGGADVSGTHYNDFYSLNLKTLQWTQESCDESPEARSGHTLNKLSNSTLVLFGGMNPNYNSEFNDIHLYDVNNKEWENITSFNDQNSPPGTSSHSSVIHENRLIVFGGFSNSQETNSIYSFDFEKRCWYSIASRSSFPIKPRQLHASCMISPDIMGVFGGKNNHSMLSDLQFFDFRTSEWHQIFPKLNMPLCSHTMQKCSNQIITCGGISEDSLANNLVMLEDSEHQWNVSIFQGGPEPRFGSCSTGFGNRMYVFGGINLQESFNDLHCFSFDLK